MNKLIAPPLEDVTQYRSCEIKRRFQNMKSCLNELKKFKKMKKYQKYQPFTTVAYHCKFCDGWHIGNKRID